MIKDSHLLSISNIGKKSSCSVNQTANLQLYATAAVGKTTALCSTHHVTATALDTVENTNRHTLKQPGTNAQLCTTSKFLLHSLWRILFYRTYYRTSQELCPIGPLV